MLAGSLCLSCTLLLAVHNVKMDLILRKEKGNAQIGTLQIELNDLHVRDASSSTPAPSNSTNPTGNPQSSAHDNSNMTDEEELLALAQLINLEDQSSGISSSRPETTSTSESTSQATDTSPSSSLPAPAPNTDAWLFGAAVANQVARQGQRPSLPNSQQSNPQSQSRQIQSRSQVPNGPTSVGGKSVVEQCLCLCKSGFFFFWFLFCFVLFCFFFLITCI